MDFMPRFLVVIDPDGASGRQLRETDRMCIAIRMRLGAVNRRHFDANVAAPSVERPAVSLERPVFHDERV